MLEDYNVKSTFSLWERSSFVKAVTDSICLTPRWPLLVYGKFNIEGYLNEFCAQSESRVAGLNDLLLQWGKERDPHATVRSPLDVTEQSVTDA